ncbi:hypothetical protein [Corallincola holothuriorum]|nr:hypothetical protein [Corallincola holothuriorum]
MHRHLAILLLFLLSHTTHADEPLYLRCDCNWWQALPEYQMQQVGSANLYRTEIEIKNASFPINFKLVDVNYTPGSNFGYLNPTDRVITMGRVVKATPDAVKENFEFMPPAPGTYQIFLDLDGKTPMVFISKAI